MGEDNQIEKDEKVGNGEADEAEPAPQQQLCAALVVAPQQQRRAASLELRCTWLLSERSTRNLRPV